MIKQKLFKMSNDIKSGEDVKAIEIMQLLRSIKLFKLDQNTSKYYTVLLKKILFYKFNI